MSTSPNPIDLHAGRRLRMRRMFRHVSQEKLGEVVGLTFQQIQKYEKGTNRMSASRIQQFADFLQVTPAYFFEGAPTVTPGVRPIATATAADEVFESLTSTEGLRLARAFAKISDPKIRQRIADLVTAMAGSEQEGVGKPAIAA